MKQNRTIRKSYTIMLVFTTVLFGNLISCNQKTTVNYSNSTPSFYETTEKEDTEEDTILNFAVMSESSVLKKAIDKFNKADNGYFIKCTEYNQQGYGEMKSGEIKLTDMELLQNIINTSDIDIISSYTFQNEDNYRILQEKGAFADLYSFMSNDEEINTTTLNSHVLSLNEINGKLYSMPTFYCAYTMGGNPEYVGTKNNWTFDEMISYWSKMPENATIHGGRTKEIAFDKFVRYNLVSFIDYEKGEAHFDSQDFRKCLEFCNSFEYGNNEKTNYDIDAPQFVNMLSIDSFMGIYPFELGSDTPKITFVGFPSSDGNGAFLQACGECFSISAKSSPEKQKGAWEFIRTFFTEEWQEENVLSSDGGNQKTEIGFCINNNAFETIKNNVVGRKYANDTYQDKGEIHETIFPSKADCDKLTEYINSIDRWEVTLNDSVDYLIYEEVMLYFSGEKSLDECIDNIQNRTSLWLSEQH